VRSVINCHKNIISQLFVVLLTAWFTFSMANAAPREAFADRYAAIVVDAHSGKTLFQANANARRYPASLTKMMTLYLLFEAMNSGRVSPNTPIPVSAYAAARPPTKIGFRAGQTIPAEAAAKALITKSANDVAVAIAEYLGGSESRFANLMNAKARKLGMMNTHFNNASGLPDVNNYSTARDLAILSLALREHFPNQYRWFKTTSFKFRGQTINGHNRLVKKMRGVDGIKTGYTNMSGSNLATSMRLDGKSIVAVVMGGRSAQLRDIHMAELLQRYLPQASTTKTRGRLLADARQDSKAKSYKVPIPVAKHVREVDKETVLAFASSIDRPQAAAQALDDAIVSTPVPSPKDGIDPVTTGSATINAQAAIETGTSALQGWSIQIGSLPSAAQAQKALTKAANTANAQLAHATTSTEVFERKGKRFYRARFNGFTTKKQAVSACNALKKANFNCYALLN